MHSKEKILDDIARVAGGTVSVFSGLNQAVREDIRSRVEEVAMRLDLVPREDFERLEALLTQARLQQDAQEARIQALEETLEHTPKKKKGKQG